MMENPPSSELTENKPPAKPKNPPKKAFKINFDLVLDGLTILLMIGAVFGIIYFMMVYTFPESNYNPFPPPTMVPTLFIPSITPLPTRAPATVAPTPTPTTAPTATNTPSEPSPTAIPATPIGTLTVVAGKTTTPTLKVTPAYSFAIQDAPKLIDAQLLDPNHGCTWMGVAGHVYDLQNGPATKIEVQLFGILDGKLLNETSLTGTAIQYGPSGYEFTLASKPIASTQRLGIRLVDQSGVPLSDRIFFDTSADCAKNLVLINFKQVK
jgi:hypothetical protein